MITNNLIFDTIIYAANFSGVVSAYYLKKSGQKILILNRYGFFGGTITESLNLYQRKLSDEFNSKIVQNLIDRIASDKDGILFENSSHLVLNPEVSKYILQKFCEENEIELLFHIFPSKIIFENDWIELIVIGREGEINLKAKQIFDFSTEFTLAPLIDKSSRSFFKSFVNFITLPVQDEKIFDEAYQKIKLNDNRWWISLQHENLTLFDAEEIAQNDFDLFDEKLRQQNSRIQIVPAQSNLIFDFERTENFNQRIFFIKDFVSSFNQDDEIIISSIIEKAMKNELNF